MSHHVVSSSMIVLLYTYCFFIFFRMVLSHVFYSRICNQHFTSSVLFKNSEFVTFFLFSCECTFLSSRNFHFVISAVMPDSHQSYDNRFPLSAYVARRLRVGRRLSHLSVAILKQSSLSQTYFVFEKELQFQ